jgi:hypothetical protein
MSDGAPDGVERSGGVWRVQPQRGGGSGKGRRVRIYPLFPAVRPLRSAAWLPEPWSAAAGTGFRSQRAVWMVTPKAQPLPISVGRTRL